jgi:hypothetical protein
MVFVPEGLESFGNSPGPAERLNGSRLGLDANIPFNHLGTSGTPGRTPSVTSVRCSFQRCASFSPRNQTVHQRAFRRPASIPLCDLRALCAMLTPQCTSFSPRNQTVHQRAFHRPASIPQSPSVTSVTSVRCSLRWLRSCRRLLFHQRFLRT